MFDSRLFEGRTVVLTGAGRGIGAAVLEAFLHCGARVIAHGGRAPPAGGPDGLSDARQDGRVQMFYSDFSTSDGVTRFAEFVRDSTHEIDVLINNAGTMVGRFPAETLTNDQYASIVQLNQTSVVDLTRELLPLLQRGQYPAIVNTVSISARMGGSAGSSIYAGTKAFVATYSKALARELASSGIRVNCVSPGTIATDFHERYSSPEKLEATRLSIPLQRLGTAEDCAPAYVFLAAHALSGYVTGQVLEINGGQFIG